MSSSSVRPSPPFPPTPIHPHLLEPPPHAHRFRLSCPLGAYFYSVMLRLSRQVRSNQTSLPAGGLRRPGPNLIYVMHNAVNCRCHFHPLSLCSVEGGWGWGVRGAGGRGGRGRMEVQTAEDDLVQRVSSPDWPRGGKEKRHPIRQTRQAPLLQRIQRQRCAVHVQPGRQVCKHTAIRQPGSPVSKTHSHQAARSAKHTAIRQPGRHVCKHTAIRQPGLQTHSHQADMSANTQPSGSQADRSANTQPSGRQVCKHIAIRQPGLQTHSHQADRSANTQPSGRQVCKHTAIRQTGLQTHSHQADRSANTAIRQTGPWRRAADGKLRDRYLPTTRPPYPSLPSPPVSSQATPFQHSAARSLQNRTHQRRKL